MLKIKTLCLIVACAPFFAYTECPRTHPILKQQKIVHPMNKALSWKTKAFNGFSTDKQKDYAYIDSISADGTWSYIDNAYTKNVFDLETETLFTEQIIAPIGQPIKQLNILENEADKSIAEQIRKSCLRSKGIAAECETYVKNVLIGRWTDKALQKLDSEYCDIPKRMDEQEDRLIKLNDDYRGKTDFNSISEHNREHFRIHREMEKLYFIQMACHQYLEEKKNLFPISSVEKGMPPVSCKAYPTIVMDQDKKGFHLQGYENDNPEGEFDYNKYDDNHGTCTYTVSMCSIIVFP